MKDDFGKELSVGNCVLVTCTTNSSQYACGVITKINPATRSRKESISVKLPYFDFFKKEVNTKTLVVSPRCNVARMCNFDFDDYVSNLHNQFSYLIGND